MSGQPNPPALLAPFVERLRRDGLQVDGIVVDRLDHPLVSHDLVPRGRVNVYSGAKTFTSLAVGLAMGRGLLDLDEPLVGVFPELAGQAAPGAERITLRHLLTMTSGNEYTLFTDDEKSRTDILDRFLAAPVVHEPGSTFEYSSGCSYVLSRVVERRTGHTLRDFLDEPIFRPLGIEQVVWDASPAGHTWGGTGLHLTTEEYSRLGRLLLRRGEWRGHQLVASEWIAMMHDCSVEVGGWTDDPEGVRYGLHVWHCTPPGSYRADGRGGQYSVVLPHLDASITLTSHRDEDANDILRAAWDDLLPALGG